MRIHNFRAGFATNSSSSHSVVLLPPWEHAYQIDNDSTNYNWEFFRLVTEEDKLRYLAAQLFTNYCQNTDAVADIVNRIGREIDGYSVEIEEILEKMRDEPDEWHYLPSVDHQSVLSLPKEYNPHLVEGLIKFFRSPRVVILGGNDNDEGPSNFFPDNAENSEFFSAFKDKGHQKIISRQDGNYWTLFNQDDGTKVRFSFDDSDHNAETYVKSKIPELIDCKITEKCTFGNCSFCYMGSTKEGKHAPFERIAEIARLMGEMGVFEVAIGGGEPTEHPDFAKILRVFYANGVLPNFTTLSDKWLEDKEIMAAVCETVGGIGVSCLSAKGLSLVNKIKEHLVNFRRVTPAHERRDRVEVTAQHVVGSVPIDKTVEFVKEAFDNFIPVLLLGFKEVGFGANYERFDDNSLETYIKLAIGSVENRWAKLSIDTALVNRYPNLAKVLGAPEALVTSPEGAFSCYIDATTSLCGPSSYVQPYEMLPLPMNKEEFIKLFGTF